MSFLLSLCIFSQNFEVFSRLVDISAIAASADKKTYTLPFVFHIERAAKYFQAIMQEKLR